MKNFLKCIIPFIAFFIVISSNAQQNSVVDSAILRLQEGNMRFADTSIALMNLDKTRIKEVAEKGQSPYATIIGCSDSRVPIEYIFDAGIGELFIIRVAGNVINVDEAGSIEYGVEHLKTPVLVVLGHTHCGAVTAVAKHEHVHGNIPALVSNIEKPVEKAKEIHGTKFSDALLNEAIKQNVFQSIEDLLVKSEITRELIHNNKLKVVGAIYLLETGIVEWLGEHPNQKELVTN